MKRSTVITNQVATIAGIHLLLFILYLFLSKHFIPHDYSPSLAVPIMIATLVYIGFGSPTIWFLLYLDRIGIRCPDTITYILIPMNSIIAAIILRGLYAGFQMARKQKAQQGGPGYPPQGVGSPDP